MGAPIKKPREVRQIARELLEAHPVPRCLATFHKQVEPDAEATEKEGRPMFREKDYVTKVTPGDADPTHVVDREVWPIDLEEYPEEWAAYKAGLDQSVSDTPVESVIFRIRDHVEAVKALPGSPVTTVEELASLSDATLQRFHPGFKLLRDLARDFLRAAKENALILELRGEIERRDEQIADLKARLEELRAMVQQAYPTTAGRR